MCPAVPAFVCSTPFSQLLPGPSSMLTPSLHFPRETAWSLQLRAHPRLILRLPLPQLPLVLFSAHPFQNTDVLPSLPQLTSPTAFRCTSKNNFRSPNDRFRATLNAALITWPPPPPLQYCFWGSQAPFTSLSSERFLLSRTFNHMQRHLVCRSVSPVSVSCHVQGQACLV